MSQEESIWISEHHRELKQYSGKWIAVWKDRVVASGDSVLEATERLFLLADKSRADVLGARVEVQRQEKNLADRTRDSRIALLTLRRVLGDSGIGEFETADTPLEVFDPSSLDVEELVRRAIDGSPRVVRDQAQASLTQAQARQARGTRWPTLRLSGDVGRMEWGLQQSALFDLSPGAQSSGGLQLALSWDVFDRFDRRYQIASADVITPLLLL